MKKSELLRDLKDLIGSGYYGNVSMLFKRMNMKELGAIRKLILELDNIPMTDLSLVLSVLIIRVEEHYGITVSPTVKKKVKILKRLNVRGRTGR